MKTATYIKLDTEVKQQAQERAAQLGFSLSAFINAQLKQFVRAKKITFELYPAEQMTPALEKKLAKIDKDIKAGKNLSRILSSPQEVRDYLQSL